MLYVYAISDCRRCPSVRGLQGASLSVTGVDGVFAVWSIHEQPLALTDESALWDHERVVEALLEDVAVLPMRLGSWLPDHDALLDMLRERNLELRGGLDRVRGAVELGVRAVLRDGADAITEVSRDERRPGTAYLLSRLNQEKRAEAVTARIHRPLAALSRATCARRTSLAGSVNTAYLVDREQVGSFRAAVEDLETELGEATVVCTGPWPPYSFTPRESER